MLVWPHEDSDWASNLAQAERVYTDIARQITRFETLLLICPDPRHQETISRRLEAVGAFMPNIIFLVAPVNDTWVRDTGPVTVMEGSTPLLLNFVFNAWGGKYPCHLDQQLTRHLHEAGAFHHTSLCNIDFILEGGSIESNGDDVLMTTTRCLLSPDRNPGYGKDDIEYLLKSLLGSREVIWLAHGLIVGDDTDGHIDMLARFCDTHTIAYASCDDAADEHYAELQAMQAELEALRTRDGDPYRLVPLPLPQPVLDESGQRLPASYANFLIINGAVLVPVYGDPADTVALDKLTHCFPDREIIGIDCRPLILQHGSLHCVTMQLPAGVLPGNP